MEDKVEDILEYLEQNTKDTCEINRLANKARSGNTEEVLIDMQRIAIEEDYRQRTIDIIEYALRLINGREYRTMENIPEELKN
jgi:hypothetical protein